MHGVQTITANKKNNHTHGSTDINTKNGTPHIKMKTTINVNSTGGVLKEAESRGINNINNTRMKTITKTTSLPIPKPPGPQTI